MRPLGAQGHGSKNILVLTHTIEISYIIKLIVNKMKNASAQPNYEQ